MKREPTCDLSVHSTVFSREERPAKYSWSERVLALGGCGRAPNSRRNFVLRRMGVSVSITHRCALTMS